MVQPESWVPFRWPSGPLEAALLKTPHPAAEAAFNSWHKPETLAFLRDTPINCIVATWAAGRAEDAEQQRTLKPLIDAAHERELAVIGRVSGDCPGAAAAARAAGLDGLLADNFDAKAELPVIGTTKTDDLKASGNARITALTEVAWPQIPSSPKGGSGGDHAGPTGNPWIDSNVWAVQLARVKAPEWTPWVLAVPPSENRVMRANSYLLAVADAYAGGGRWPVAIDPDARRALAAGEDRALKDWKKIADAIAYFERRRPEMLAGECVAKLGVCSDFSGDSAFLANEFLNLAARRLLLYRILDKPRLRASQLDGLKGVIWIDDRPPSGEQATVLNRFVEAGGLLIVPASAAHITDGLKPTARQEMEYATYTKGAGRIAAARQPWSDPFTLATEAHMLLSRRNDVVRLYNAGSSIVVYTKAAGKARLQILNFAAQGWGFPMTAYVAENCAAAKLESFEFEADKPLELAKREAGAEIKLPQFSVYANIELGG